MKPVPQEPAQLSSMNYMVELSEEELKMVVSAIQELPAKFAVPITRKIQMQVIDQIKMLQLSHKIKEQSKKRKPHSES